MSPTRLLALFLIPALALGACASDDRVVPPDEPLPVRAAAETGPQPDSLTGDRFEAITAFAERERLGERPIGEAMQTLGERFVEAPYIVGPLEAEGGEQLVCRLDGFDCFTFVESMLALARGAHAGDLSWQGFAQRIEEQRYREGVVDGYCSRLHYFTEWIRRNEARGLVRDVTEELGGRPLDKRLDFMTTHRDRYPALSADSTYACIEAAERGLRDLKIHYIPQDRIAEVYDRLRPGDIVATATDIEGLDVTHTGLVYASEPGAGKGLLHASTSGGVKVSPDLQSYVQNIETQIGIVVARPLAPGTPPSP